VCGESRTAISFGFSASDLRYTYYALLFSGDSVANN
jgi:hypothetical protein